MKVSTGIFTTGVHAITVKRKVVKRSAPTSQGMVTRKKGGRYREGSTTITLEQQQAFLRTLMEGWTASRAALAAGAPRVTFYKLRENDERFAAAWDAAVDAGTDTMEDEAARRGTEGYDKPVFYKGTKVAMVREHSDMLLMFMLNGRRPEKFRQNVKLDATVTTGKDFAAALGVTTK